MRDESVSNGFYTVIYITLFALAIMFFNNTFNVGYKNLSQAKEELDDHQLVVGGEYVLNEHVLTGAEVIFDIESAYKNGLDVYINGSRVGIGALEEASKNSTKYNASPFNIIQQSQYSKTYLFDSDYNVTGISFNTH